MELTEGAAAPPTGSQRNSRLAGLEWPVSLQHFLDSHPPCVGASDVDLVERGGQGPRKGWVPFGFPSLRPDFGSIERSCGKES